MKQGQFIGCVLELFLVRGAGEELKMNIIVIKYMQPNFVNLVTLSVQLSDSISQYLT